MKSDVEIAKEVKLKYIEQIAEEIGLNQDEIETYGKYKAKISLDAYERLKNKKKNNIILITSINPTPMGEGKTTTAIGLSMAINKLGFSSIVTLREPSLGPCMGLKGGATGGGYSQVLPMEDINLHFTGDIHAVTTANNLLCAALDNHIHQGNKLNIDPKRILIKRAIDMNDRTLRNIVIGLGEKQNGVMREDGFIISVASEVMAILCLSENISDLKRRLGNILIAFNQQGEPIYAKDLKIHGAMAALLKDAIKPNLVQTIENTPAIIHGGPFANIAHGTNSILALDISTRLCDYTVVEAGFGADLGAEKYFDIVCRKADVYPNAVVIVVTIKALKYHGGQQLDKINEPNLKTLEKGLENLKKHIQNIKAFNTGVVVALNKFPSDTDEEIDLIKKLCEKENVEFAISSVFSKGSEGGIELAEKVLKVSNNVTKKNFTYPLNMSIEEKIKQIAKRIYGANDVEFSTKALKDLETIKKLEISHYPVCIAKTQYSLSDNPKLLGRPYNFTINIRELKISNGAEFIVAIAGDIMTMPGLPRIPSAENIDIDEKGNIYGIS
ncbi:formate--tetrahydrofolate ligase [Caldicellulosiruptoraceae bacterium PP1]